MSDDTQRHDRIRDLAYSLWQQAGEPEGQEEHFWHLAEKRIMEEEARASARLVPRSPPTTPPSNTTTNTAQ